MVKRAPMVQPRYGQCDVLWSRGSTRRYGWRRARRRGGLGGGAGEGANSDLNPSPTPSRLSDHATARATIRLCISRRILAGLSDSSCLNQVHQRRTSTDSVGQISSLTAIIVSAMSANLEAG